MVARYTPNPPGTGAGIIRSRAWVRQPASRAHVTERERRGRERLRAELQAELERPLIPPKQRVLAYE